MTLKELDERPNCAITELTKKEVKDLWASIKTDFEGSLAIPINTRIET